MLTVSNLTKNFGSIHAVKGVSFTVEKGQVLGFLGPNGAGKSTTMRMITGFIPPTSGTAVICGHDITADPVAAKRCIGYLPENAPSYHTMTVTDFLTFIGKVRGFEGGEGLDFLIECFERFRFLQAGEELFFIGELVGDCFGIEHHDCVGSKSVSRGFIFQCLCDTSADLAGEDLFGMIES